METHIIGQSVPRKEGLDKVTGRARYVDDLTFPEMIYGVTLRSAVARGRIRGIHFEGPMPWQEFTMVTEKDIPSKNCVGLLVEAQPCLADEFVNHPEEPVVLLAHPDKYLLEEARRAVRIEIEPLPPIFTIDDSLARKQAIWGEDNIFKSFRVEKGDVDRAWSKADFIVEGEYKTGAQEQLYIEPQGMAGGVGGTGSSGGWRSTALWMAARIKRFRRSFSRAEPFTPPDHTTVPTCAFAAAPWPPTRLRTARFADLARRRASLPSNAIWTAWQRPSGSRRKNCAGEISSTRARLWPSTR